MCLHTCIVYLYVLPWACVCTCVGVTSSVLHICLCRSLCGWVPGNVHTCVYSWSCVCMWVRGTVHMHQWCVDVQVHRILLLHSLVERW